MEKLLFGNPSSHAIFKEMTHEKIRTISTTHSGDRFAVAEFEKRIQIWDLNLGLLRILETDFDFGAKRLSISNSGKYKRLKFYQHTKVRQLIK